MADGFRLTDKYVFFNNCIFTENGTPLPATDDEEILTFFKDVKFYCGIGSGSLAGTSVQKSPTGKLFLTNYRVIYKPETPTQSLSGELFNSFHCSLQSINSIDVGAFSLIIPNLHVPVSTVYFDIYDSSESNRAFSYFLKDAKIEFKKQQQNQQTDKKYYYCDVLDRQRSL